MLTNESSPGQLAQLELLHGRGVGRIHDGGSLSLSGVTRHVKASHVTFKRHTSRYSVTLYHVPLYPDLGSSACTASGITTAQCPLVPAFCCPAPLQSCSTPQPISTFSRCGTCSHCFAIQLSVVNNQTPPYTWNHNYCYLF